MKIVFKEEIFNKHHEYTKLYTFNEAIKYLEDKFNKSMYVGPYIGEKHIPDGVISPYEYKLLKELKLKNKNYKNYKIDITPFHTSDGTTIYSILKEKD